jgi:hypothetical protein
MIRPKKISKKAQLITGVGASSWFTIKEEKSLYRIERFSLEGDLECSKLFTVKPNTFNINNPYRFTYISHCKKCTLIQDESQYNFFLHED